MHELNHHMFNTIPDLAIMFVCVAIRHAIQEYKSGHQIVPNFEGNSMNGQSQLSAIDSVQTKLIRDNCEQSVQK